MYQFQKKENKICFRNILSHKFDFALSVSHPCGMLVSHSTSYSVTSRTSFMLFSCTVSYIVSWHQQLQYANTVLEQHKGTVAFFLHFSLSSFSALTVCVFASLTVLLLFLGASIVCVNYLMRTSDLILGFHDGTSVCTVYGVGTKLTL